MRARRDGVSDADLIELRLDALARPDVAAALAGRQKPVVVTCRPTWEGGLFDGAEADRVAILEQALAQGAEFVDVEWRAQDAHRLLNDRTRSRIVVSMHDFAGMPGGLASDVEQMRRLGPAVVKVAVTPSRLGDLVPLLEIGRRATDRTVLIAMGVAGLPTRALPAHFGSCWTYAGNGYAPGQIAADRLLSEFRLRQVDARTPVYAVVGRPIGHSVSPAMHNAAFEAHDAAGVYVPCEAESFDDFLGLAEALPIVGASVTAPFKEDAAAVADGGAGGGGQHAAATGRRRVGRAEHRRGRVPGPARRHRSPRCARLRARGGWRCAVGGRGLAPQGRPHPCACTAIRRRCGAGRGARSRAWTVAGAVRRLGCAGEHDPGRDASRCGRFAHGSAVRSTDDSSTTWSTTRGRRGCCAMRRSPAAARSTGSTCSWSRRSGSSSGGPA